MEMNFYKEGLEKMGINVLTPKKPERAFTHHSSMRELKKDILPKETKNVYLSIMDKLKTQGAEAIILGCTEIHRHISRDDYDLPLFSPLQIHANAIAKFALKE